MKSKAITIEGNLVKINDKGHFFRLNGNGVWVQINNEEIFKLLK
tara:strand:+ start:678 stop:809 length:132 start_codon:yes stop_codon:yes gene_type:complete